MYNKYLPVGTVVLLKGGKKRIMITGFCCIATQQNKMFDYTGCLYPEGYISKDKMLLFDHSQIEKIFYMGLSDDEDKKFKQTLTEVVAKLQSQNTESGATTQNTQNVQNVIPENN